MSASDSASFPASRVGFCCKFVPPDPSPEAVRAMNTRSTTITHLAKLPALAAHAKVAEIVAHNMEAVGRQVAHVAGLPPGERLLRLSSDLLPAYTHPVSHPIYADPDMRGMVESGLARIGDLARAGDVRLSMHPDQFCVISSASESARRNGVRELEYHAELMAMMGYGSGWHPHGAHVNIHGGGRAGGVDGIRAGLGAISETARNLVTLENDEVSYGLDDLLGVADLVPLVLDLHHHWIASRGEWIGEDDPRIEAVRSSWCGTRPVAHVSVSREVLFPAPLPSGLPSFAELAAAGVRPTELRAHADTIWNPGVVDLVRRHLAWADFEVEAKSKNIASSNLADQLRRSASRGHGSPLRDAA